ncbi:TlyA family RNA methyltransferase [Bartonella sp. LJL80]
MAEKQRLDVLLVEKGFFPTRSRARDAIARKTVTVDGRGMEKAGQLIAPDSDIIVSDPARHYVSRAALKLLAAFEGFPLRSQSINALDIGASTGGFTQVLLERGAQHIFAVDVGHGQLDVSLLGNSSITLYEGLNARDLQQQHLNGRAIGLVVSDVSFISLKLALPPALSLAEKGAQAVLLVKPQFEAGREAIGKGGLLKDPTIAQDIAQDLFNWLNGQAGWQAVGLLPSPIEGGDGNKEFLLFGEKTQ